MQRTGFGCGRMSQFYAIAEPCPLSYICDIGNGIGPGRSGKEVQAMQQQQAYDLLPADATWFSSFGYPGRDNFRECWRRPNGEWWTIIKRDEDWSIESREG